MINKYIRAILPHGLIWLMQKNEPYRNHKLPRDIKSVLSANKKKFNIHKGERCFIAGTGASINSQNLLPLKDEIVISLSKFYYHKDYENIKPKYQIHSGFCLHPDVDYKTAIASWDEMNEKVLSEIIFLNYGDREFITTNKLLSKINNRVRYYYSNKTVTNEGITSIDMSHGIYHFPCISILGIQIAIYLGFKEIYLLGLDHDWILKMFEKLPPHFYDESLDPLSSEGQSHWDIPINTDFNETINSYHEMWYYYNSIKKYAKDNDISIINCTNGGLLDVFPRMKFENLF